MDKEHNNTDAEQNSDILAPFHDLRDELGMPVGTDLRDICAIATLELKAMKSAIHKLNRTVGQMTENTLDSNEDLLLLIDVLNTVGATQQADGCLIRTDRYPRGMRMMKSKKTDRLLELLGYAQDNDETSS